MYSHTFNNHETETHLPHYFMDYDYITNILISVERPGSIPDMNSSVRV